MTTSPSGCWTTPTFQFPPYWAILPGLISTRCFSGSSLSIANRDAVGSAANAAFASAGIANCAGSTGCAVALAPAAGRGLGVHDRRQPRACPVGHLREPLLRFHPRSPPGEVPLLRGLHVTHDEWSFGPLGLIDEEVVADRLDLQRGKVLQRGFAAHRLDRARHDGAGRIDPRGLGRYRERGDQAHHYLEHGALDGRGENRVQEMGKT